MSTMRLNNYYKFFLGGNVLIISSINFKVSTSKAADKVTKVIKLGSVYPCSMLVKVSIDNSLKD